MTGRATRNFLIANTEGMAHDFRILHAQICYAGQCVQARGIADLPNAPNFSCSIARMEMLW